MAEDNTGTLQFLSPTPILPTKTSTPAVLSLSAEPTVTACSQSLLEWSYTGPSGDSMIISLYGARIDDLSTPIEKTIDSPSNIEGQNQIFWEVDVAQGAYIASASIPSLGLLANSSAIIVLNGTDTSCLNSPGLSLSFSPLPSTSSIGSTNTSPTTPTSSASDSASNVPANGAVSGSRSTSSGAIAGAVVGAIAGIALVAILILFLKRCRSRSAGGALGSAGVFEKRPKGAVAIGSRGGSFSSAHGRFGADTAGLGASRYHTESTSEPAYPSGNSLGHANSVESNASAGGPSIEKLWAQNNGPFSSPYDAAAAVAVPLDTHVASSSHSKHYSSGSVVSGTTVAHSPGGLTSKSGAVKPSRHSSLLYPIDPFSTQPNTPSPRPSGEYFDPYGVSHGVHQGQVPVQLFSPPSNASAANSLGAQSHQAIPRDISSASSSSPDLADELLASGLAAAITVGGSPTARRAPPPPPLPRTSSGEGRPRGKTTRKPAPTYAPSVSGETLELVEPTTPRSTGTSSNSNVTTPTTAVEPNFTHMKILGYAPTARGSIDQHSRTSIAPSSSVGNDWSSAAAHSHSTPSPALSAVHLPNPLSEHWPELNHKSSFGDRQVHYLIPDPPSNAMK